MIELINNELVFEFPEVHPLARCRISFERTLRIPDDNRDYPLPPGLGHFPIEHVDDFAEQLPETWRLHGGVLLPMYQSEALWIKFSGNYPCAVKVASGKINAISGEKWTNGLRGDPQDYVVIPDQPWIDGFNVSEDFIRQFVAMPLGGGFTAEEQLTNRHESGGLQLIVHPMKQDVYEEYLKSQPVIEEPSSAIRFCFNKAPLEMGLAPGGLMRQKIYNDKHGKSAWDQANSSRCFVHLANSEQFQAITGRLPPHVPPSCKEYTDAGLPWFELYDDSKAVSGSSVLGKLTSIAAKVAQEGKGTLDDNDAVQPENITLIRRKRIVRETEF